jgi:hypothetical protein
MSKCVTIHFFPHCRKKFHIRVKVWFFLKLYFWKHISVYWVVLQSQGLTFWRISAQQFFILILNTYRALEKYAGLASQYSKISMYCHIYIESYKAGGKSDSLKSEKNLS